MPSCQLLLGIFLTHRNKLTKAKIMDLRLQTQDIILHHLKEIRGRHSRPSLSTSFWRVLAMDAFSTKMVSNCCTTRDIFNAGIALVESLHKSREPVPFLEVIYILRPIQSSALQNMINDLNTRKSLPYRKFHILFTEACPDAIFDSLTKVVNAKHIKTFTEINVSFIPIDNLTFLVEKPDGSPATFNNAVSEQVATICTALEENPSVRHWHRSKSDEALAFSVSEKIKDYFVKTDKQGDVKDTQTELLIIDRRIDCISPLLHELTFQAMSHDLLDIKDNQYNWTLNGGKSKTVCLENNESWDKVKFLHIAEAIRILNENLTEFKLETTISNEQDTLTQKTQKLVKKLPQHQAALDSLAGQIHMAEECLSLHKRTSELCGVEQDLATGYDEDGNEVGMDRFLWKMNPFLMEEKNELTEEEKVRFILMYFIQRECSLSENSTQKLLDYTKLDPHKWAKVISNMTKYYQGNDPVTSTELARQQKGFWREIHQMRKFRQQRRTEEVVYTLSRWKPILKDVVESVTCMDNGLPSSTFPYIVSSEEYKSRKRTERSPLITSVRKGGSNKRKRIETTFFRKSKLIIFIVGGMTYSEIRSIHEVNQSQDSWEIILGSTEILTPNIYLDNIQHLH